MNVGVTCIGLHQPKYLANIGGVIRAAHCYDVNMVGISGDRVKGVGINHASNTPKGHRHLPVLRGDLKGLIPFDCVPVAVDLVEDAVPLYDFVHPKSAFYIFGPEDGTLGHNILDWCVHKVMIPMNGCSNLAATVNVVLYDRMAKRMRK